jgi:hypothetical protein
MESWIDGCLGEGEAATRARVALATVRDAEAKRACAVIARDEQRHADLAWDILAWALSARGGPAKERLREELRSARSPVAARADDGPHDRATWSAHGRLLPRDLELVREAAYGQSVERGAKLLDTA